MYQYQRLFKPKPIERIALVNEIFEVGIEYEHIFDTCLLAVSIADNFVSSSNSWTSNYYRKYPSPAEHIYSRELAHTALVLSAKFNEDENAHSINRAVRTVGNYYVKKLEFEVLNTLQFDFPLSPLVEMLRPFLQGFTPLGYGTNFYQLAYSWCLGNFSDPRSYLLGITILHKKKKWKDEKSNRFERIISVVAEHYNLAEILENRKEKCLNVQK